jgi:hypothetical protein
VKPGLFDLRNAGDLRDKLRDDLKRLKSDPTSVYVAFDFFVTAFHLLDWQFPRDPTARKAREKQEVLLQVTSHLANGAKHFVLDDRRHTSVASTFKGRGYFGHLNPLLLTRVMKGGLFNNPFLGMVLIVELEGSAATVLGAAIDVVSLAELVMRYWDAQPL